MAVEIIPVALGFDTCFILKAEGVVVIDAGAPKKVSKFLLCLKHASIDPADVRLIVITHGHWDHIGSARDMKQATGAVIAMHEQEAYRLEQSLAVQPPGVTIWGKVFSSMLRAFMPLIRIPSAEVDLPLADSGLDLSDFGIPGRILHTPGHSIGSLSVLLDSGEVFVGDMAVNKFPLSITPGLPIFAEEPSMVVPSWELLLESGAREVYPAHGKSFSADVIRRAIAV